MVSKKILEKIIFPLIILGFTLFLLMPLFSQKLLYTDDAELHAARVASYYLAVKQSQIPPRWAPNLNSGYGYPVLNFTYPLPYLMSTFIYMALPVSVVLALNLTIILLIATGVLGIYYLARQFSLSKLKSALTAGLYLTAPYTLINIYSRTALGEIAFFAVLPWVMWSMENLISKKKTNFKYSLLLIVNTALLLITHQTSLIITFPILTIYYWLRIKNKQQTITLIKRIVPLFIISLLTTAWYWIPALWEKQFVILDRVGTITNYLTQFPQHWSFFFQRINHLDRLNTLSMTSIGYSSWIIFLISGCLLLAKKKIAHKKIVAYLCGVMALTTVLMMPFTRPIWLISGLGSYVQYPWRLLSVLTLTSTLLFIHLAQDKMFRKSYWLTAILIITSGLSIITYNQPRGFQNWSDYELFEYFKTTTTFNEFQPIWAAEYTRHFPTEKISFRVPGKKLYDNEVSQSAEYAQLEISSWNGSQMEYVVETDQAVDVIQKTAYFPGWELKVNQKKQRIKYQDLEFPGHITYYLEPGQHHVQLRFTQDTPARKIGAALTLIGVFGLITHPFWVKN